MITINIPFSKINLTKATKQGLDFAMECLLDQQWFEAAAKVRDELKRREQHLFINQAGCSNPNCKVCYPFRKPKLKTHDTGKQGS